MKLLKRILPLCIAAVSLIQCTNPQTAYPTPTYYVEQPAPVDTRPSDQAISSAQISSIAPINRDNASVAREQTRNTSSFSASQANQGETHYYTNVDGNRVQAPTYYDSAPAGACAQCEDGTYSFSQNRRGACSRHGGVRVWLR
jgi:hypothetical protein